MKKNLFKVLVILSLTGCTANTVKSVNNLAGLSKTYTTNLNQYLEKTEETIITLENYSAMRNHKETSKNYLENSDKRLENNFKTIDLLTETTALLNDYFSNLNALLDNESNKKAAESLEETISIIEKDTRAGKPVTKGNTAPVTGEILEIYDAYRVNQIIKRDHKKIAKALKYNNETLKNLMKQLDGKLIENENFKNNKIEKAYADKENPLYPEWAQDRTEYIKLKRSYSKISTNPALKAGEELQEAWDRALEIGDLQEVIEELQKFNKLLSELKLLDEAKN